MRNALADTLAVIGREVDMAIRDGIGRLANVPTLAQTLGIEPTDSPKTAKPRPVRYKPLTPPTTHPPGDGGWIRGKKSLSRLYARAYLGGVSDRWLRQLLASGVLEPDGRKNITTKSLRDYYHQKHPQKGGSERK